MSVSTTGLQAPGEQGSRLTTVTPKLATGTPEIFGADVNEQGVIQKVERGPGMTPKVHGVLPRLSAKTLLRFSSSPERSPTPRSLQGSDFPSAPGDLRSGPHQAAAARGAGRGDAKVTLSDARGRRLQHTALPRAGARAPPSERRPIPREIGRRLFGLLCL